MKGDFSKLRFNPLENFSGVMHQQGRVLLDQDWNASSQIIRHQRQILGRDAIGPHVAAVPVELRDSFKVTQATSDGVTVEITLEPGRVWLNGRMLQVDERPDPLVAEYLAPPIQTPPADPATIASGVRDAVILEVWEEAFNGFQDPLNLIEPALGGVDTTERVKLFHQLRLLRLGPGDECGNLADRLTDDFDSQGKLTVSPADTLAISGECPVELGGGYTGFEHYLYRIEIADPDAGNARFKWSRFDGGLVGRGTYDSLASEITVTANDQMINHCGLTSFYLEALQEGTDGGPWRTTFTAAATLSSDGILSLTNINGTWPGTPDEAFFRLWDGWKLISDYPTGLPTDNELENGILLAFEAPTADNSNYTPGDYWTFPVRAKGLDLELPPWPTNAPPQGVRKHRASLAILNWNAAATVTINAPQDILDCRHIFQPLADQSKCCTFIVGDGDVSHGQFNSMEQALRHLPEGGGKICLLPGVHHANVTIDQKKDIRISGCGLHTVVRPNLSQDQDPIFMIRNSKRIELDNMTLSSETGSVIHLDDQADTQEPSREILIHDNRMIALVQAIFVKVQNDIAGNNHIRILNNEIGMLDKAEGRPAIYSQADDVLIEQNRIIVIPAPDPDDPSDPRDPDDPDGFYDPCAELLAIYANKDPLFRFLYGVFAYMSSVTFTKQISYLAQGGIQIGGGSEGVKIIRNRIIGGNGNGITLGHVPVQNPDGTIGISHDRIKSYLEITNEDYNFLRDKMIAFVYEVSIEDNMIVNMGLSGIGVPAFFKTEKVALMFSVEDLTVYRNRIEDCAHLTPDETAEGMLDEIGFGGIVLAVCENAIIQENRIENNGKSQLEPVCGILILYGEKIEISNNRILNNGPRAFPEDVDAQSGLRGGVVIRMTFKQLAYKILQDKELLSPDGIPAVKIHDNIITQPLGQALFIMAFGPVSVIGNQLTSQGADFKVNPFSLLAGSVFILNLGISKDLMKVLFLSGFKYLASANMAFSGAGLTSGVTTERTATGFLTSDLLGIIQRILYLPSGNVLFANNQTTLDLRSMDLNFSFSSQLIASLDDIAYTSNQSECTSFVDYLYTDVAIVGVSIRSNDNRFQEGFTIALNSLFSFGFMNTAASNQATHCLQVYGARTVYDPADNIVLDPTGCPEWLKIVGQHLAAQQYQTVMT